MKTKMSFATGVLLVAAIGLAGCAPASESGSASTPTTSAAETATVNAAFPAQVESCDQTLTFEKAPERILLLSETDFSILHALGLSDNVVAKSGNRRIDASYPELNASLDAITDLAAGDTGTGGAKVSTEAALSVDPDIVFGYDEGADREQLANASVPLYSPDAMCAGYTIDKASFDLVTAEIDKVAAIFGRQEKAAEVKGQVAEKIASLTSDTAADRGTAAALFVMPGTTQFYSYGTSSMIQPIFEVNGLTNGYDEKNDRVFEATMESLLDEDPDWLVLMADSSSPDEAKAILMTYQGASELKAVKNDQVIYLPFVLTDPPTLLSVDGAVRLGELLEGN